MDDAEGGVHKHTKLPVDAPAPSSGWAAVSTRVHTAVRGKLTRLSLPVAGAGGIGASITAVATHQVSPQDMVAIGGTVVAGLVAKCVDSHIRQRPELIEKRAKAETAQVDAQSKAQSRSARDEVQQTLMKLAADDPSKTDQVMRMLTLQVLSALPDQCPLTGQEACDLAAIITQFSAGGQPKQSPPNEEGGGELRALGLR